MNSSIEAARKMPPISLIISLTSKFREKATDRFLLASKKLNEGHAILPYVQKKADREKKVGSIGFSKRHQLM